MCVSENRCRDDACWKAGQARSKRDKNKWDQLNRASCPAHPLCQPSSNHEYSPSVGESVSAVPLSARPPCQAPHDNEAGPSRPPLAACSPDPPPRLPLWEIRTLLHTREAKDNEAEVWIRGGGGSVHRVKVQGGGGKRLNWGFGWCKLAK